MFTDCHHVRNWIRNRIRDRVRDRVRNRIGNRNKQFFHFISFTSLWFMAFARMDPWKWKNQNDFYWWGQNIITK